MTESHGQVFTGYTEAISLGDKDKTFACFCVINCRKTEKQTEKQAKSLGDRDGAIFMYYFVS